MRHIKEFNEWYDKHRAIMDMLELNREKTSANGWSGAEEYLLNKIFIFNYATLRRKIKRRIYLMSLAISFRLYVFWWKYTITLLKYLLHVVGIHNAFCCQTRFINHHKCSKCLIEYNKYWNKKTINKIN